MIIIIIIIKFKKSLKIYEIVIYKYKMIEY
jgi:hypothetical protein